MRDSHYAYAVARIRANEPSLLTAADIEQLIQADSLGAALRLLAEKGFMDPDGPTDIDQALQQQAARTWELLTDIAPDIQVLHFLIVKHDFHNIKGAVKAFVASQTKGTKEPDRYYLIPSIVPPAVIHQAVFDKQPELLPDFARQGVEQAYDVLIRTGDGQLADTLLDAMALNSMLDLAFKTRDPFIQQTAEWMAATANLKIALRAVKTGKDADFLDMALCRTRTLDKTALIRAAGEGMDSLLALVESTPYGEGAEPMARSAAAFEKWCDDRLMELMERAKYVGLGVEPLVAYYLAKEAEIKTVRIVLYCKRQNLPADAIRERVRRLYV